MGSTGLTSWDTAADVHGSHPSPDLWGSSLIKITLGNPGPSACGGSRVIVDNDANARSFGTGSELDLGSLDESGLGVGERAVKARQVTLFLRSALGGRDAGCDLLAKTLKRGDLASLFRSKRGATGFSGWSGERLRL